MTGNSRRNVIEECGIIGGLLGAQFIFAGGTVLMSYLMSLGLNPLTVVVFCAFSTFLVFSLPALYYERNKWPKQFSLKLWIQIILISFGGVTLFQSLYLKGIKLTSPAMATAMPNLAPGLIFVIAVALGFEKVEMSCSYSRIKILGTALCVMGAVTMSLLQSGNNSKFMWTQGESAPPSGDDDDVFDEEKIIGSMYLMAAVFVMATNILLQASALSEFPAPMSLCAVTSLLGAVISSILELIQEGKFDIGWPNLSFPEIIGYSVLGGTVSGVILSFNAWVMKKKGPVLVAMFSPIATLISVIFSIIALGEDITLGSLAGMSLMFTGLYFFLWAKGKEDYSMENHIAIETPLLS